MDVLAVSWFNIFWAWNNEADRYMAAEIGQHIDDECSFSSFSGSIYDSGAIDKTLWCE